MVAKQWYKKTPANKLSFDNGMGEIGYLPRGRCVKIVEHEINYKQHKKFAHQSIKIVIKINLHDIISKFEMFLRK